MITIDENIPGWCPADMLTCFGWLMQKLPANSTVVEIGVLWGRVTRTLALNRSVDTKIICIDPCTEASYILGLSPEQRNKLPYKVGSARWVESYFNKFTNLSLEQIVQHSTGQADIKCIQQSSENVSIDFTVDLAIIDGLHHGPTPTLDMEKFISQPQCLIIMDDWHTKWPAIISAVSLAREKYHRSIYIPARGNYVYILPQQGAMLSVMKEFMSLTATDNIWKLIHALHATA